MTIQLSAQSGDSSSVDGVGDNEHVRTYRMGLHSQRYSTLPKQQRRRRRASISSKILSFFSLSIECIKFHYSICLRFFSIFLCHIKLSYWGSYSKMRQYSASGDVLVFQLRVRKRNCPNHRNERHDKSSKWCKIEQTIKLPFSHRICF